MSKPATAGRVEKSLYGKDWITREDYEYVLWEPKDKFIALEDELFEI